jgi:hypothetical protein
MGSDYAVGDLDPVGSLKAAPDMTDDDLRRIASATPARLLGLDGAAPSRT